MNTLSIKNKTLFILLVATTFLSACSGDSSDKKTATANDSMIKNETPFAFVQRSVSDAASDMQSSFDSKTASTNDSPLEFKRPYEFNPGAKLYVRSGMDPDATQTDVLASYFNTEYDVKDLNVSPDGKWMIFSARASDTHATDSTWNIFLYEFENKTIKRVIKDDALANSGQDTNPIITWDGVIIFSSDRDAGNPATPRDNIELVGSACRKVDPQENPSLLHSMDLNGNNIVQITYGRYNHDIKPSLLKDGRIAFVRWERSYRPIKRCVNAKAKTDAFSALSAATDKASIKKWDKKTQCKYAKSTDKGLVSVSNQYKLLALDNDKKTLEQLYDTVTASSSDEAFLAIDRLFQAENGNLFGLVKHQYNPVAGGAVLELQPSHNPERDSIFAQLSARALTAENVDVYPGQLSVNGWFSALWPYRDGSSRLMVSWANCTLMNNNVSSFCSADNTQGTLDIQYGLWVFDPASNTRSPIVAAKKDTIYSEIAIAQPHNSADLNLTPFNPGFLDNKDATYVQCDFENKPPVAQAGPDRTTKVNKPVQFDGSASSDPDADPLSYRWSITSAPTGSTAALTHATTVNPTLLPDVAGVYDIQLIVNDGKLNSAADSLRVTVTDTNRAPVANAGVDQTVLLGNTVTFDGTASQDPDGVALTYQWSVIQRPTGSTVNLNAATSANPTFTPDRKGNYIISLVVSDGVYNSGADTVNVSVGVPLNNKPVAHAGADRSGLTNTALTLTGSASADPDGDPLSYRWQIIHAPGNSNAVLSNATMVNPAFSADQKGRYTVQLIVNDSKLDSDPDTVVITLMANNAPPIANAGEPQSGFAGDIFTLNGSGSSDPDADPITYQWSVLSAPGGSAATLSSTTIVNPQLIPDVVGTYTVQLIVSDGELSSDAVTVTITANAANNIPVANAGPDQRFGTGQTLSLDGSASTDRDGDPLLYEWQIISPASPTAQLSDTTAVAPTMTLTGTDTYVVQLVVFDGEAFSAPDTVNLSFHNTKPVANAGMDQSARQGEKIQLDGSASIDIDGDALTYQWRVRAKPAASQLVFADPGAVRPHITVDAPGTFELQLVVNDGNQNSLPDTVIVTVTDNSKPVAHAGRDRTINAGTTAILDGSASSDADNDPLTYHWSLVHKPATSQTQLHNSNSVSPTLDIDSHGDYVAQLIVNDGTLDSAPDTVRLTSNNLRPVAVPGDKQIVSVNTPVTLDGTNSYDPDGSQLSYHWSILHKPTDSATALQNELSAQPSLTPDIEGIYIVQLIVNDGLLDSYPQTVQINATNKPDTCELLHETKRTLPVTIRDFKTTHPDFETYTGNSVDASIVKPQLGPDNLPVYQGYSLTTTGKTEFDQWYRDVPGVNITIPKTITLSREPDSTIWTYSNMRFFPIDGEGWGNTGLTTPDHNYHFTLEAHLQFDYEGGEHFTFKGDDDLWLFIDGKLVIDIGGPHPAITKSIHIDDVAGQLGLVPGKSYAVDLFFAERHTVFSRFSFQTSMKLKCKQ